MSNKVDNSLYFFFMILFCIGVWLAVLADMRLPRVYISNSSGKCQYIEIEGECLSCKTLNTLNKYKVIPVQ